jgi:antitoxin MazE
MNIGKVTSKSQITIPKEIAKAINLKAGDYIEFEVANGGIFIKPVTIIPKDQTWFWTKKWQEGEKQADDDIKVGRVKSFNSVEELMADLND